MSKVEEEILEDPTFSNQEKVEYIKCFSRSMEEMLSDSKSELQKHINTSTDDPHLPYWIEIIRKKNDE